MKKYITKQNIVRVVLLLLAIVIISTLSVQKSNANEQANKSKEEVESVRRSVSAKDSRISDCVEVMDASIAANAYYILSDMTLREALLKAINGDVSTLTADIRTANGHRDTAQIESDKYTLSQVNMCRDGK
jgi:putative lipase involved disintegration of autophagic bodies